MSERSRGPSERLAGRVNGSEIAWTCAAAQRRLADVMRIVAPRLSMLILALLPLVAGAASAAGAVIHQRQGDDPRWAARDWDDRNWTPGSTVPARSGIRWVRYRFTLSGDWPAIFADGGSRGIADLEGGAPVDSIFMAAPCSYEVYWDGRLIGRNGVVGATREAEATGPLDNVFAIPRELLGPGEHVVALRLSTFHYNFPATEFSPGFTLINAARHYAGEIRRPVFPLIGVGGAVLAALISALLFLLVGRWRPLLLCSVISFALAVFYLLIACRWIRNDPYEWFCPRLVAITCVMTAIAWLFPWLLLEQFAVPRRAWWLIALVPLLAAAWTMSPLYEIKSLWLGRAMLTMSVGIASWAVWRRRPGARFVLAAVLVALLLMRANRRDFLDPTFFATFGVLVLFVFTTLGLQFRADRQRAQAGTLTSARLELELLKKNLQPHFLLNTLATIVEVIEQEPKTAVTLIEALAREFRILARVAGEKLIPLGHELELCRAHLRIMSLRKGARCSLVVAADADERALVPPALFHTLVENGLTHLLPRGGEQRFELSATRDAGWVHYTLVAHGEPMERERSVTLPPLTVTSSPFTVKPVARREGTGLRYIKARLEESFPGRWSLRGEAIPEGWRTVIEIEGAERVGGRGKGRPA